jgi:hypothetical protein
MNKTNALLRTNLRTAVTITSTTQTDPAMSLGCRQFPLRQCDARCANRRRLLGAECQVRLRDQPPGCQRW